MSIYQIESGVDKLSLASQFDVQLPVVPRKCQFSPCSKFVAVLGDHSMTIYSFHIPNRSLILDEEGEYSHRMVRTLDLV